MIPHEQQASFVYRNNHKITSPTKNEQGKNKASISYERINEP